MYFKIHQDQERRLKDTFKRITDCCDGDGVRLHLEDHLNPSEIKHPDSPVTVTSDYVGKSGGIPEDGPRGRRER